MNFQIAFVIALIASWFIILIIWWAERWSFEEREGDLNGTITDLKKDLDAWMGRYHDMVWARDRSAAEYQDLLDFLTEEGIEVRPYQAPETPKFELRISNRVEV